jgi:hypothetical protein
MEDRGDVDDESGAETDSDVEMEDAVESAGAIGKMTPRRRILVF